MNVGAMASGLYREVEVDEKREGEDRAWGGRRMRTRSSVRSEESVEDVAMGALKKAPSSRKRGRDSGAKAPPANVKKMKGSRILKRIDPPVIMTRREIYNHGDAERHLFFRTAENEILEEFGLCRSEEVELAAAEKILRASTYQKIEQIKQEHSPIVSSQVYELARICRSAPAKQKAEAAAIMDYVYEIVKTIPGLAELDEASQDYLEFTKQIAENLPVDLSMEEIMAMAAALEAKVIGRTGVADLDEAADKLEAEEDELEGIERIIGKEEYAVRRALGNLILVAENDLNDAAEAVTAESHEEVLDKILLASREIMGGSLEALTEHSKRHSDTCIQNIHRAHYHKLAVEMAKCLILHTGGINFGLIRDLEKELVSDELRETMAFENMNTILEALESNPEYWQLISSAKVPKSPDLPSNELIRACLEMGVDEEITEWHVQVVIVSGLLDHFRQMKAGTCFTTGLLISMLYQDMNRVIKDYIDLLEDGLLWRMCFHENRAYPFQAKTTMEALDTLLTVTPRAKLKAVEEYEKTHYQLSLEPKPSRNAAVYMNPGIQAACRALSLEDCKASVIAAIQDVGKKELIVDELLGALAKIAFAQQNAVSYVTRSHKPYSLDELLQKAQYAFGAQTNHPLHRAWEHSAATMVYYFGMQYCWPNWTFDALERTMHQRIKNHKLQAKKILKESFLLIISTQRYIYDANMKHEHPYLEHGGRLFKERNNQGVKSESHYGYQLFDTGVPSDFEFSTQLYKQIKQHGSSSINLERFGGYAHPTKWKKVEGEKGFKEFLFHKINLAVDHMIQGLIEDGKRANIKEVEAARDEIFKVMDSKTFMQSIMKYISYPNREMARQYEKNEYGVDTSPTKYFWGGWVEAVMETMYGFSEMPVKTRPISGSPEGILQYLINFMKKQPEEIQDRWDSQVGFIPISSPVHVFNLTPAVESFRDAWRSEIDANTYVNDIVKQPGVKIAQSRCPMRVKRELIEFIASNNWHGRHLEHHDMDRLKLTIEAKSHFDDLLRPEAELAKMTVKELYEHVQECISIARESDPGVGRRYLPWERRSGQSLQNKIKMMIGDRDQDMHAGKKFAKEFVDFARNREDSFAFSEKGGARIRELARAIPRRASYQEFRTDLYKIAKEVHEEEVGYRHDKVWMEKILEGLDSHLISLMPKRHFDVLLSSGIVCADTNWKEGISDAYFLFVVNPGSGEIEMLRFFPDDNRIKAMGQEDWFSKKGNVEWLLPRNYIRYPEQPIINIHNALEMGAGAVIKA
ncbi:hypothetical protein SCG7109_AY_00040 [Chlamydiales bacterium SCGC AG-110-M15]|nr:hypothetical protein SCG7109_AY_00040 [Chlamydiales bacterium SCGC AG-110-M15]